MSALIAIIKERSPTERRVALVPDVARRLIQRGYRVGVETGAGVAADFPDAAYAAVGAQLMPADGSWLREAAIYLAVQPPSSSVLELLSPQAIVVSLLFAHRHLDLVRLMQAHALTSFAMEWVPRISRAQSMDVLSSQATVAGYRAVLLAASLSRRFFPMLTTAAGTIRPAQVLILGAGVAGLQAIATARRLGAIVSAYDVRRATKEQVESLGARFVDLPLDAESVGGYARELTEDEKRQAEAIVAKHVAQADVVITCAQIPGRDAPRLVSEEMVAHMKAGAVIVDIAAETGGNCACTVPGQVVERNGVRIAGPLDIGSDLAMHASEMYARNLDHFLSLFTLADGKVAPNWDDEVVAASVCTHAGDVKHAGTLALLQKGHV